MKICLITAFPPSRRGLNEYGFHLARELRRDPLLSLTILADELESPAEELPDYDVIRCWCFDGMSNPVRLTKVIHDIKPDVVWFNLLFSTFGNKPVPAFLGLGSLLFHACRTLHPCHVASPDGQHQPGRLRNPLSAVVPGGRFDCDPDAADVEFDLRFAAGVSANSDRKIPWRQCSFPCAWNFRRLPGASGFRRPRQSRASNSRFWKMGHAKASGVVAGRVERTFAQMPNVRLVVHCGR